MVTGGAAVGPRGGDDRSRGRAIADRGEAERGVRSDRALAAHAPGAHEWGAVGVGCTRVPICWRARNRPSARVACRRRRRARDRARWRILKQRERPHEGRGAADAGCEGAGEGGEHVFAKLPQAADGMQARLRRAAKRGLGPPQLATDLGAMHAQACGEGRAGRPDGAARTGGEGPAREEHLERDPALSAWGGRSVR